ncbi:MAG TPA: hypothetical protein PLO73_04865 [Spirochaetota bacterium]|nr:hypothetical protein [Spirochaetota bacterium]HPP49282.1 hypothetical protein [Spirochaetota bacterium]
MIRIIFCQTENKYIAMSLKNISGYSIFILSGFISGTIAHEDTIIV